MAGYVARAYTPANAALLFVGDITPADAVAHASKWFGDVAAPARATPAIDESLPVADTRVVARAHVDAARVRISWRIPTDHDDPERWETLQQLLGGTETALARWKLRDKLHLVTSVQSSYARRAHGSLFTIDAVAAAGHDTREVVAGIDAFLRELVATAPPPSTIEWSRLEVVRRHLLGRETASERAAHLVDEWIAEGTATRAEPTLDFDAAILIRLVGFGLRNEHRAVLECVPDAAAPISGVVTSRIGGGFVGR
jgi:predicted Zn-dependent peptidase